MIIYEAPKVKEVSVLISHITYFPYHSSIAHHHQLRPTQHHHNK